MKKAGGKSLFWEQGLGGTENCPWGWEGLQRIPKSSRPEVSAGPPPLLGQGRGGQELRSHLLSLAVRALGSRPPAPVSHFYHGSCVSKLLETDPQVPEPVYPGGWLIGQDSVDWGLQGPEADMTIMPWASMFTSLSSVHP